MTMNLRRAVRRAIVSCAALPLLTTMGVGAATGDVADAVQRGDLTAVRALLAKRST